VDFACLAAGILRACEDFAFIKSMAWIIAQKWHYTFDYKGYLIFIAVGLQDLS